VKQVHLSQRHVTPVSARWPHASISSAPSTTAGLLHSRLEQAGLTVLHHDRATDTFDVEGDPAAVQSVIERWDGEGRVELV
jgi:hypothetical protein